MASPQVVINMLLKYSSYREALGTAEDRLLQAIRDKEMDAQSLPSLTGGAGRKRGQDPVYLKVERALLYHDKKIARLEGKRELLREWVEGMDSILLCLTGAERKVLEHRYLLPGKPMPYTEIASELGYSERQVMRIRCYAIKKLCNKI